MFDAQVVDYIKKALEAGQTIDQIKSSLAANGWSEIEINENILTAKNGSPQPEPLPQTQYHEQAQPGVGAEVKPEPQPEPMPQPEQPKVEITRPQPQPEPEPEIQTRPERTFKMPEPEVSNGSPVQNTYTYKKEPLPTTSEVISQRRTGGVLRALISLAVMIMVVALVGAGVIYFKPLAYIQDLISRYSFIGKKIEIQPEPEGKITSNFANYNVENTKYTPSLPDYTIEISELANLSNFETANKIAFTETQKQSLTTNNFFIASNFDKFYSANPSDYSSRNDDWTGLYKTFGGVASPGQRQPENAVFITSDYLTHVYHKLLEQEFSYIEELKLYPALTDLSNSLLKSASKVTTTDPVQIDSYKRLTAYFLVSSAILNNAKEDYNNFSKTNYIDDTKVDSKANVLKFVDDLAIENTIPDDVKNLAKQEIELIFNASKLSASPLFGQFQPNFLEDYTQYTPRSHYSKNVILRNYFRAMMWFGRMNFLLSSTELTRDAASISQLLTEEDLQKWESIYNPTSFLVGQADDLTIYDFKKAATKVGYDGSGESLVKLQTELKTYSNPQIMSSAIEIQTNGISKEELQNATKGFRFMGQRFTPDAFIFSTLTQGDESPDPTTGQKLPSTPTALMVSTLMGDVVSKDLLNTWISTNAATSDKVLANKMNDLQGYFDKTSKAQWTSNIYWSWIYTIKSLFKDTNKTGYPTFMKTADWGKKTTQSFLGSWTELKHDTLLYAKQSYAELGGGGDETEPKPVPKGYVEPNVEFLDRLIALTNMTTEGLVKFNLLSENLQARNNSFADMLKFFRTIAVSELENKTITDDDFEKLRLSGYTLDQLLYSLDSSSQLESNARSALIADVHTDVKKGQILYEANGVPNYIYVAVKDANGTRLTKGLVYSYYEFTNPITKRINDTAWQNWNYSSTVKLLKLPDWSKSLIK